MPSVVRISFAISIFTFASILQGCTVFPDVEPVPYNVEKGLPKHNFATVWAKNTFSLDRSQSLIKGVNGDPSWQQFMNGHSGAISLMPGTYKLDMIYMRNLYTHSLHNDSTIEVNVEAGHTYLIDYKESPDHQAVFFSIKDYGLHGACRVKYLGGISGSVFKNVDSVNCN